MNTKDIDLKRKRKSCQIIERNDKKSRTVDQKSESSLWVDRYRPLTTKQVIGQQGDKSCVNKLIHWLNNWYKNVDKKPSFGKYGSDDGSGLRAALLSGPPGVGKTTSAQLVCKELDFDYIELNASDARSKKTLEQVVKELLKNTTLSNYFNTSVAKSTVTSKHVVIMDEVDGMAGNEDRGGVAELIQLIKTSKVPIICICNDRSHPKMRSLVSYCFDLRFYRPRVEQIKGAMMSIAYKEGFQIAPNVLHELIVSSNQDIRQVLHNLSLLSTGGKRVDNLLSEQSIKDIRLGPFEALRKVFTGGEEYAKMSFQDKSDLFFSDYSIMPLFNFENYINVNPSKAKTEFQKLRLASKAIESMAFGDIIEKQIRSTNNWSLLPLEAAFASVMPGAYMTGYLGHQIQFPSFMGKLSTINKRNRLLQELKMHMNLKVSGSKTALNLDYLEPLRDGIIQPLLINGTGGVPTSIEKMENYCLRREDIESIIELTLWTNQKDPMSGVESKVKSALTRAYNKEGFCLPYSLGTVTKGKKGKPTLDLEDMAEEDDGLNEEVDDTNEDDIGTDPMIKAKKTTKTTKKSENESKTKTNKTKKTETKSSDKKKTKKEVKTEVKSGPKESPKKSPQKTTKKEVKSETKNGLKNSNKISPKKEMKTEARVETRSSPKKVSKTESKISPKKEVKSEAKNGLKNSYKKSPKKEMKTEARVETRSSPKKESKTESKTSSKKKSTKKESKTPTKAEQTNGQKSRSKAEPKSEAKSETKSKKTPENKNSKTVSKGKQLTINSFFSKI